MRAVRSLIIKLSHLLPIAWKEEAKWTLGIPDMAASLRNMAKLGFDPRHVLDIGAYVGDWASMCKRIFPRSSVLMFEPQADKAPALKSVMAKHPDIKLMPTLLGREAKDKVTFYTLETGSSILRTDRFEHLPSTTLPMTTLSEATRGTEFARPQLIKIDVQGAEMEVFAGGEDVLRAAEAVVMEVTLIGEYAGTPLAHEMIAYLQSLGFRPYDVCTIWRNTPSGATNELDMIFVKEASPLWDRRHYTGAVGTLSARSRRRRSAESIWSIVARSKAPRR